MSKCGPLWLLLDNTVQDQWRDQEYLNSISPPNYVAHPEQEGTTAVDQWKKHEKFKLTLWIRKIKRDVS
jgi:hypothetical protein